MHMASQGGSGLTSMVNGKSAHKQFMIRQSKSDYVKRVCSAKSTIDNGLPKTFRHRLQRDGRLPKTDPMPSRPLSSSSRPTNHQQQHLTNAQLLSTSTAFNALDTDQMDSGGGDLLETHRDRFTNPKQPFTPRINNSKSRGVVAQSRLLASGIYVKPPPKQKRANSANDANGTQQQRRRFDGTYDVFDGGLAERDQPISAHRQQQQQQIPLPHSQRRTADWVLDGHGLDGGDDRGSSNAYNTLFSKIDEAYYPFADAIIKDIASSGVTSNRMIRIVMQKHVELNRNRLKARQMEEVCQLISEYLGINDEDEDDNEDTYTAGFGTSASASLQIKKFDYEPQPRYQRLDDTQQQQQQEPINIQPQPRQPRRPQPLSASSAAPASVDDDPPTLTEVSQMDAVQTPTPLPRDHPGDRAGLNDPANDSRSATPLDDFQDALRTQLRDVTELDDNDNSDIDNSSVADARPVNNNPNNDDTRSISEFGVTLRPGQFEMMQTAQPGSPSRSKTVRFSS